MDALERIGKMIDGLEAVAQLALEEATFYLGEAKAAMARSLEAGRDANELKVILVLAEAQEARAAGNTCAASNTCPCGANPECGCKEERRHDGG